MSTRTYILSWKATATGVEDVQAKAYATQAEAERALPGESVSRKAFVVRIPQDLVGTSSQNVALYNALSGDSVKRFETQTIGRNRLFQAMTDKFGMLELSVAPAAEATDEPTTTTSTAGEAPVEEGADDMASKKKANGKKSNGTGGRARKFELTAKVTVLAKENPHRKGTWGFKQFEMYRTGMTVGTLLEKGAKVAYLSWNVSRGDIKIG